MNQGRRSPNDLWVCHLGTVPYRNALAMQQDIAARRRADELPDTLLLLEHPPVYTRGRRSLPGELTLGEDLYRARGIEIVPTDRGGRVTYHGPGQIVVYPIMGVTDVVAHLRTMEDAIVAALAEEGIQARSRPQDGADYTGVWVQDRKIASLGVHVSRGISTHGFAVNVENDLAPVGWVVACGLPDVEMTSLAARAGARRQRAHVCSDEPRRASASASPTTSARPMAAASGWSRHSGSESRRRPPHRRWAGGPKPGDTRLRLASPFRPAPTPPSRSTPTWTIPRQTQSCPPRPPTVRPCAREWGGRDSIPRKPRWDGCAGGARARGAPATRAQAPLAEGAGPRRRALPRAHAADPRRAAAHRLPGGRLPERRGVLGAGHRDVHDPRRHLHAAVRVLQRQDRPPHVARSAGARACGALDRAHGPAPRRRHLGGPRRPARQGSLRVRRGHPPGSPSGPRLPDRGAHPRLPGPRDAAREGHCGAPGRVQPQRRGRAAPVPRRAARLHVRALLPRARARQGAREVPRSSRSPC